MIFVPAKHSKGRMWINPIFVVAISDDGYRTYIHMADGEKYETTQKGEMVRSQTEQAITQALTYLVSELIPPQ